MGLNLCLIYHRIYGKKLMSGFSKAKLHFITEAVVHRCSVKKVFLEITQNLQENTCARVSSLIKLQAWGEISKNTFSYRTPVVATSVISQIHWRKLEAPYEMNFLELSSHGRVIKIGDFYWLDIVLVTRKEWQHLKKSRYYSICP